MKMLILMRHAKSSWKNPGQADHDRPLNPRGRRDAPRMAEQLKRAGLWPDEAICSTARRARETWELMSATGRDQTRFTHTDRLYLAMPADILEAAAGADSSGGRLLMIGHNPGMEILISQLTDLAEPVPTAAIACVELPIEKWTEIRKVPAGRLVEFWYPQNVT